MSEDNVNSETTTDVTTDITIIGGGLVGLLFANALADKSLRIAIIDSHLPIESWDQNVTDLRTSAVTRATQRMFQNLGVWDAILQLRVGPFRDMHVWDSTGNGVIHFDSAEIGEAQLGHIIENSVMQYALTQRLHEFENVNFFCPCSPRQFTVHQNYIKLTLNDGRTVTSHLLVGADGSNSWVRESIHIPVRTNDYRQTAIVANVKTELPHQHTAWQRFLPAGPLAFLPLYDGSSSIVWSTSHTHAAQLLNMSDVEFCEALTGAFESKLGKVLDTSRRASFPLKSQHARHYVRPRVALIGDAAHTIHPLAGQGVNLGFADAACLAQVVVEALNKDICIGDYDTLRRYERWRKGENLAMLSAMTGFKTLFGNKNPFIGAIRNLGLNITDNIGPVKNTIIRFAMGLIGDLPELAKP